MLFRSLLTVVFSLLTFMHGNLSFLYDATLDCVFVFNQTFYLHQTGYIWNLSKAVLRMAGFTEE